MYKYKNKLTVKKGMKTRGSSATAKHTDSPAKETTPTQISKEEIQRIDAEVLDGMGSLNRGRLTKASPDTLTLRQMQGAGSAWLASFVGHPDFRKRAIEAGMQDPINCQSATSVSKEALDVLSLIHLYSLPS